MSAYKTLHWMRRHKEPAPELERFLQGQVWLTPSNKKIRLIKEVIKSGDSTWLAVVLPTQESWELPSRFERVAVMARYLRGCTLIEEHK